YFASRRRHTRSKRDWSSDVCSSDLAFQIEAEFTVPGTTETSKPTAMRYRLTVAVAGNTPEVVGEALEERGKYVFDTHPDGDRLGAGAAHRTIKARMRSRSGRPPEQTFLPDQPP